MYNYISPHAERVLWPKNPRNNEDWQERHTSRVWTAMSPHPPGNLMRQVEWLEKIKMTPSSLVTLSQITHPYLITLLFVTLPLLLLSFCLFKWKNVHSHLDLLNVVRKRRLTLIMRTTIWDTKGWMYNTNMFSHGCGESIEINVCVYRVSHQGSQREWVSQERNYSILMREIYIYIYIYITFTLSFASFRIVLLYTTMTHEKNAYI